MGRSAGQRQAPGARLRAWLLSDLTAHHQPGGPHSAAREEHQRPWWRVMCLTGLDYFSTLGYQPGIAALAAGTVAPVATLVLVALTLFGALPVYRRVARESPHGQGSIAMLERILPRWRGKVLVLVLLGFAATDFVITITLSAADASAHILENPYVPDVLRGHQLLVTLALISVLGAVFLKGFGEAIGIAVVLVGVYLGLSLIVVGVALVRLLTHPDAIGDWRNLLLSQHPDPVGIAIVAVLVFPRLALGLSGFETGVAVMPLIQGDRTDTFTRPLGRIRGARRLLATAALTMSVYLIASSVTTTMLIPPHEFEPGGGANGRALAFLAHAYLGEIFGTLYDLSTVLILWFAGASAMAGLLNLIPRYLPRYGMAPNWTRAVRPLVLVLTGIAFLVTIGFRADVNAQGGAYATGVLVLISSAAVAVTLSARKRRQRRATLAFGAITLVLAYTTVTNVVERPDGVKIAGMFIAAIIVTSLLSRVFRITELRVAEVRLDPPAWAFITEAAATGDVHIIANEPQERDEHEYRAKETEERADNHIPAGEPVLFLEVTVRDPSEFQTDLDVIGEERWGYRILRVEGPSVANAIAGLLLHIRDITDRPPHIYFEWSEGPPLVYLVRYFFLGEGEVAPVTREVLRQAEPDPGRRPFVHVA